MSPAPFAKPTRLFSTHPLPTRSTLKDDIALNHGVVDGTLHSRLLDEEKRLGKSRTRPRKRPAEHAVLTENSDEQRQKQADSTGLNKKKDENKKTGDLEKEENKKRRKKVQSTLAFLPRKNTTLSTDHPTLLEPSPQLRRSPRHSKPSLASSSLTQPLSSLSKVNPTTSPDNLFDTSLPSTRRTSRQVTSGKTLTLHTMLRQTEKTQAWVERVHVQAEADVLDLEDNVLRPRKLFSSPRPRTKR